MRKTNRSLPLVRAAKPPAGSESRAELEALQRDTVLGQALPEFFFRAGQAAPDLPRYFLATPHAVT